MYGIIYTIRNKVNNKYYVGQTTHKRGFDGRYNTSGEGIERVYNYHRWNKKKDRYYNRHLLESIEKHGFDSFEVDSCFYIADNEEELNEMESFYIEKFDSFRRGYNYTTGGDSTRLSEETKLRISETRILRGLSRGKKNPMFGMSGKLSPNWGVPHTAETKRKISEGRIGVKHTRKSRNQMSETSKLRGSKKGGRNSQARKVRCVTTGEVFDCISDASMKYFGKTKSRIGSCCRGESKYSGKLEDGTKLEWEYVELD